MTSYEFMTDVRFLMNRWMSPCALDLAERLLTFDPSQRITAEETLNHEYFKSDLPEGIAPEYVHFLASPGKVH
jgi:serine/threonine protein kinase